MSDSTSNPDGRRKREVTGNVLLWTGRLFIIGCGLWLLITSLESRTSAWVRYDTERAVFFWGPVLFTFGISFLWPPAATVLAVSWSFFVTPIFVLGEGIFSPGNIIFSGSVFAGGILCVMGFALRCRGARPSCSETSRLGIKGRSLIVAARIGILIGGLMPLLIRLYGLLTGGGSGPGVVGMVVLAVPLLLVLPLSFLSAPAGAILALIWGSAAYWAAPMVIIRLFKVGLDSYSAFIAGDVLIVLAGLLCLIGWGTCDASCTPSLQRGSPKQAGSGDGCCL